MTPLRSHCPMTDSFDPVHAVPRFLAEQAPQEAESAPDGAVTRSRVFKAGIVISAVTATGIAVLTMGNPAALFAHLSASLVDDAPPPSTPTIQSAADAPVSIPPVADAQALPPATTEVPARSEIAAPEPAKDQTEKSEATSETLFKQF